MVTPTFAIIVLVPLSRVYFIAFYVSFSCVRPHKMIKLLVYSGKHSHTEFQRAEAHEPTLHPSLAGAGGQPLA